MHGHNDFAFLYGFNVVLDYCLIERYCRSPAMGAYALYRCDFYLDTVTRPHLRDYYVKI